MKVNMLIFNFNDHEKFIMKLDEPDDLIHCCYQSQVILMINNEEIIIGKSIIADFAEELKSKLTLALSNQLQLHSSITKNIGYYWNKFLNEENPNIYFEQGKESKYWVGSIYLLWTTDSSKKNQRYAAWMYNDGHGNIIFDVTPTYPDTFIDPQDLVDVAAYQAWMETSYKPFFTRIIPKELAMQWIDQANLILKTIKDNVKMLEEQSKAEKNK